MGGLFPFTTFLKPYISYENVSYNNQKLLVGKGVNLVMCYKHDRPNEAYIVFLAIGKENTQESPSQVILMNKDITGKIGWYGTLELTGKPEFNVTIKSVLLG